MPEVVGFVSAVHQDNGGYGSILLPPGINEPDVLMVVAEVSNYSEWHGGLSHAMAPYGWQWLGHSGYCCTAPSAGISVSSRLTTQHDTFVGDGTDTVDWYLYVAGWQRKWIAIWAIRDADGPIAQSSQGFAVSGGPVITPPWDSADPSLSLTGIVIPDFGVIGSLPPNYAQDGYVSVPDVAPFGEAFQASVGHWAHTDSPPETRPDWYITGINPANLQFYTPGFHIIVPQKHAGVCYSWPEYDLGKNLENLPNWESRCWVQNGDNGALFGVTTWRLSGLGDLRLFGENDYVEGDNPGTDVQQGHAYQCRWPWSAQGPYDRRHVARIRFKWHGVGTVNGDITSRSLYYYVGNNDFPGWAQVNLPTTAAPDITLVTGPWETPTVVAIPALPPDTDHILELDFLTDNVKVRLALADDIETAPYLAVVPYHTPLSQYIYLPGPFPTMGIGATCSTNDAIDVESIEVMFGPSAGYEFEILVGFGDDTTITFLGWPTQDGTAKWFINGSEVEPESLDEESGSVTFTRAVPPDASVHQRGVYAG